jgi:hypothetical protein
MSEFEPNTETVRIYRGDDYSRLRELRRVAQKAEDAAGDGASTLAVDLAVAADARDAYNTFLAEARERATIFVLKALGRKQWRSLVAEHPPRTDHKEDQAVGVNEETFADALVPISVIEPKFDTPADRDALLDKLSDAQFTRLYMTAFALNRSFGEDPKELSAPSSGETSS